MKKITIFVFVLIMSIQTLFANVWQQTFTIEENGTETEFLQTEQINPVIQNSTIVKRDDRVSTLWQTSDPEAIAGVIKVSPTLENSFVQWHLNSERVSLFHYSGNPVWEHIVGDLDLCLWHHSGYPNALSGESVGRSIA